MTDTMAPTLQCLCQDAILTFIEKNKYHPRLINDLCRRVPHPLLERVFATLLARNAITDVALLAFLVPDRTQLNMSKAIQIRNCTFKQIPLNCPHLRSIDLSDCVQVCNSVVASILQGCPLLSELTLDRCHRVTDAAFDSTESPFSPLVACLSLEEISMVACRQLTGSVVTALNKMCVRLRVLNLSQCKKISPSAIQNVFEHRRLVSLNLSYIDGVSDEAFADFSIAELVHSDLEEDAAGSETDAGADADENTVASTSPPPPPHSPATAPALASPLQKLFLGKSSISDASMFRLSFLAQLVEVGLPWCSSITDRGIAALTLHCPKLQVIDLKSCQITDASLETIATNCAHLRRLDLSWCARISDVGVARLAEGITERYLQSYPSRSHEIAEFALSEKGASLLDSEELSVAMVSMESLSLSSSSGGHSRAREIGAGSGSAGRAGLATLSLVWCEQLTDATAIALMTIPTLQHVDASGCAGMSQAALVQLQAAGVTVKSNGS